MKRGRYFTQVPQRAIEDGVISDLAFRVYALLLSFDWQRNGVVWPAQETLATTLGRKPRSVRNALRELEFAGYITSRKRGRGQSNAYVLLVQVDRHDRASLDRQDRAAEVDASKKTKEKTNEGSYVRGDLQRCRFASKGGATAEVVPLRRASAR